MRPISFCPGSSHFVNATTGAWERRQSGHSGPVCRLPATHGRRQQFAQLRISFEVSSCPVISGTLAQLLADEFKVEHPSFKFAALEFLIQSAILPL